MSEIQEPEIDSQAVEDFASVMQASSFSGSPRQRHQAGSGSRINLTQDNVKNGLAQLVLTLMKLLHELLERQAIRRIDAGSLSEEEIEKLGVTLMRQAEEIEKLGKQFGLEDRDLNLDLGPLGKLF